MEQEYIEIDLKETLEKVIKRWKLISLITIISASLCFYIVSNFVPPVYQANTTLFIGKEQSSLGISLSELQVFNQLIDDYKQLIGTRLVIDQTISNLKLNMSIITFRKSLSVTSIENSRLFTVSFRHKDPQIAADVANELAKQLTIVAAEIVEVKNIRIIDKALAPDKTVAPRVALYTALAGIFGFIFSLLIILIQNLLKNKVQEEDDVEKLTKQPIKGIIPKFPKNAKQLITLNSPPTYIDESYKMLRTNLFYRIADNESSAILLTSSSVGEGKSTTISNLAVSIAQSGKRVLLMDTDLRHPTIHKIFEIDPIPGLTSIVFKDMDIHEVIKHIEGVDGLDILTSGVIPQSPSELLDSNTFRNLLETMKKSYDVILLDTPPILSVTDTLVLSKFVDGVLIVVAAGQTKKSDISNIRKLFRKVEANITGFILVKSGRKGIVDYYNHYHNHDKKVTKNS